MLSYAKYVLLAIGAIVFLFFTTRSLRKRESEAIEEPVWLRELEAPMRLSELERETAVRPAPVDGGRGRRERQRQRKNGNGSLASGDPLRRQVEELADSDPDVVAQQLRQWMQEG